MTIRYNIIGVDPSLTGTGVASRNEADTIIPPKGLSELDRLRYLVREVTARCYTADLVILEGLSYGSHMGKQAERGALHWMIRDALDGADVPVAVCPPSTRAKYATGHGGAGKDEVMIACVHRIPIMVSNNNEADAAVLAAMGHDHLGDPLTQMPAAHRSALLGVSWPILRQRVA